MLCRLIFEMHIRDFMVCGESNLKTINSRYEMSKRVFTNDIALILAAINAVKADTAEIPELSKEVKALKTTVNKMKDIAKLDNVI